MRHRELDAVSCDRPYGEEYERAQICVEPPWRLRQCRICLQCERPGFDSRASQTPWRRDWQPTPVFLPGEFHRQRKLADYSLWGHRESDTTERLTHIYMYKLMHHWILMYFNKIFILKGWETGKYLSVPRVTGVAWVMCLLPPQPVLSQQRQMI